jgi:hypothetical protein
MLLCAEPAIATRSSVLAAQRLADAPPSVGLPDATRRAERRLARKDSADTVQSAPLRLGLLKVPRRDTSWWVPLASAIVPGTGQAILGQNRFIAYLAVEAFAVLGYFNQHNEAIRGRDQYRAQANEVARALFPGNKPVGPWSYYESMEHYLESGVFDQFPGGVFTPESDETTFNGDMWRLARETYWRDPNVQPDKNSQEYRNAIGFYIARAVQPEYRWSWRNAQLEQDLYRRTILRTNQAYRDANLQIGFLIANHILSAVDAFVTIRLRGGAGAAVPGAQPTSLSATLPWAPFGRPVTR